MQDYMLHLSNFEPILNSRDIFNLFRELRDMREYDSHSCYYHSIGLMRLKIDHCICGLSLHFFPSRCHAHHDTGTQARCIQHDRDHADVFSSLKH